MKDIVEIPSGRVEVNYHPVLPVLSLFEFTCQSRGRVGVSELNQRLRYVGISNLEIKECFRSKCPYLELSLMFL